MQWNIICCFTPLTCQDNPKVLKRDVKETFQTAHGQVGLHVDALLGWIFLLLFRFHVEVKATLMKWVWKRTITWITFMLAKTHWIISLEPFCSIWKVLCQERWQKRGFWISLTCVHIFCVGFSFRLPVNLWFMPLTCTNKEIRSKKRTIPPQDLVC